MKFKELILTEGADEALIIRTALKKEYGLTNKDVSVKARSGGTSSAVYVTIKTAKALAFKQKIEMIGKSQSKYDTDEATGEILMGGNTFIFVDIDYDYRNQMIELVQKEFEKETKGKWEENDRVVLFDTFNLGNHRGENYVSLKGGGSVVEVRDMNYIGSAVLTLIGQTKKDELYAKIK